ncbi:hypothetical protein JQ620_15790 [Bradyrhizobium sp. AUGA SZCCT0274]|uniref:hypothetical protein n=1 Tax=Bradyrhizobium sp. AUGA SZCCT0274 TaxID=2807670 RepID=UPI001BA46010|nr:hypothetical protein [Bradyrhizobium sp. AUGA SZCCT0274]MBR1241591.1 hypothetical protein [Bradyrhizobium sp. AUGA SZCCT0274]
MSSLVKLIDEFSARDIVPIEIDQIVEYLKASGIKDEIYFFDADINTDVLKGSIVHWEYQAEGWTYRVADIYTARSLSPEEKRLVQAKELLHILDHRADRADTLEEVEDLIKQMILPPSEVDFKTEGYHAKSDRSAEVFAIPVLFPMAVRDLLLPVFEAGKIDLNQIAEMLVLPQWIAGFVMGKNWGKTYPLMMAQLRSALPIPDRIYALDENRVTLEVHSVPLEDDPYSFARRLGERYREVGKPVGSFVVETRRERRTFSPSELAGYTPRNGQR